MQPDDKPADRQSDLDKWRARRAAGRESLRKFMWQSWGVAIIPAALILIRKDERLTPEIRWILFALVVVAGGAIVGLARWVLNERRFRKAEKLGRVPTQADRFGKAGEITIPNHYVFIGFGLIVLVCIGFLIVTFLNNRP